MRVNDIVESCNLINTAPHCLYVRNWCQLVLCLASFVFVCLFVCLLHLCYTFCGV